MPTAKTELLQLCDATQASLTAAQSTLATLRTGLETLPDDDILPDPPPQVGPHTYFDSLVAMSQHYAHFSLRGSQDAVDAITHVSVPAADNNPCVTSLDDFASVTLFQNESSMTGFFPSTGLWKSCEIRAKPFPANISTGRAIVVWDARHSPDWSAARGAVHTHKAFQLSWGTDKRMLEVRWRYTGAGPTDDVGTVDVRSYVGGAVGLDGRLEPQLNEFSLKPGVWVRYIAVIDYTAHTFSLFVLDETRDTVAICDGAPITGELPLAQFWVEINSSQGRAAQTVHLGDVRNIVVLHDVDWTLDVNGLKVKPVSE